MAGARSLAHKHARALSILSYQTLEIEPVSISPLLAIWTQSV
jgi:hypothetical protein